MIKLQRIHKKQKYKRNKKNKACKSEMLSKYRIINFDDYANENKTRHNLNWPCISDHPCSKLIIHGSGSGKTNAFLNLITNHREFRITHLFAKNTYESKHQFLINIGENTVLKYFNESFIEHSNDMQDVCKNIYQYNPDKERKILIVFDDMIADMIDNKRNYSVITELFIRGRKLNISLVFITKLYFKVPEGVRLNSTHFFIMKIPNKRELQQIALNHSSSSDFKYVIKTYKKYIAEPYPFFVNDATLASDNPLRFRKNLFII